MTKDDKILGTIFLFSRLHNKKLLSLGKMYQICEDQVNSGLYYGNLDFNFNVDAEKNPA